MTALALLFSLSAIGIAVTAYLIERRMKEAVAYCPIGEDCHAVLTSKYSKTMGINNDVLGFVYYHLEIILIGALVLGFNFNGLLEPFVTVVVFTGALASIYFTFIQAQVLKLWCFWCLVSAVTTWGMLIVVVVSQLLGSA